MDKDLFFKKANFACDSLSSFLNDLQLFVSVNPQFRGLYQQLLINWSNLYCFVHDLKNNAPIGTISFEVPSDSCEVTKDNSNLIS